MIIDDSLKQFKEQLDYDAKRQNEKDWRILSLYHSLIDNDWKTFFADPAKNDP